MDLTRDLSPGLLAAISGPSFHPVVMVWLDWPGGDVRAHSGVGSLSWDGHSWAGVGSFGEVSIPGEGLTGVPNDFAVSLVCDLAELADYADATIRARDGVIYFGATTTAGGNVLVDDPARLATGIMDTLVLGMEAADGNIAYRLDVGLRTGPGFRTAANVTHSHEDQVRRYPTDTAGLMLRAALARLEKTLWPAAD